MHRCASRASVLPRSRVPNRKVGHARGTVNEQAFLLAFDLSGGRPMRHRALRRACPDGRSRSMPDVPELQGQHGLSVRAYRCSAGMVIPQLPWPGRPDARRSGIHPFRLISDGVPNADAGCERLPVHESAAMIRAQRRTARPVATARSTRNSHCRVPRMPTWTCNATQCNTRARGRFTRKGCRQCYVRNTCRRPRTEETPGLRSGQGCRSLARWWETCDRHGMPTAPSMC